MTEKELITKLQSLKQIKPNQNWVLLTKAELFKSSPVALPIQKTVFANVFSVFAQRKMAYAFAVLLVAVIGTFGYLSLPNNSGKMALNSEPSEQVLALRNNVAQFKVKSQNLADLINRGDTTVAVNEVKEAAKELTVAIKKDPSLAKEVALDINNNKTLLDMAGGNAASEVSDMYEAIVVSLISDLNNRTLTQDQTRELARIETYVTVNGDYATALRDILLLSN